MKLRLSKRVDFVDLISNYDYHRDLSDFKKRNIKDDYQDFKEDRGIEGFNEFVIAQIGDKSCCCFGASFYVLFTLIIIAQLYQSYIDYHCLHHRFTIHKLISTRYDLFEAEFQKELGRLDLKCVLLIRSTVTM